MADVRKNLILLIFVLTGMVFVLLFLNFRGVGRSEQKAEILDSSWPDLGHFPAKLSKSGVAFFNLDKSSNKVVFYEELDSIVYETVIDGKNKKEISRIPGIKEIVFSPDGRQIIASVSERGELKKYYFNLIENKRVALDPKTKTAAFSPDGSKIAYHIYDDDSGEGSISVAEPGDPKLALIFKTRIRDLDLAWPEENIIVIEQKETGASFALKPGGNALEKLDAAKPAGSEEISILENLGIEASTTEVNLLGNYIVYLNAKDRRLYSLKIK